MNLGSIGAAHDSAIMGDWVVVASTSGRGAGGEQFTSSSSQTVASGMSWGEGAGAPAGDTVSSTRLGARDLAKRSNPAIVLRL